MQVVLVMFTGDGERRSFSLPRPTTLIGRREDCDLRIPLGEVSRKHCRFMLDGDTLQLEDMGSSNGTYVNGSRIQSTEIQAGDVVQIGPVVFTVQIDGVPVDEEIQPAAAPNPSSDTDIAAAPPAGESAEEGLEVLDESAEVQPGEQEPIDLTFDEAEPGDKKHGQ
jgi:pSer/pThr/pTyr-binding forkhead associated (FHA) protein